MAVSSGSYVLEHGAQGTTLVVTGDWTDEAASVLANEDADALVLNYARGFRERSLGFLDAWPIRQLQVLARTIDDVEPVYRLAETLEDLSLATSPRATVDCARFPLLHSLWVEDWEQIRESLPLASALQSLGVYGFRERDLLAFTENRELRRIRLKQAPRLECLVGLETLSHLEVVQVFGAQKLNDVTSLYAYPPRLRELWFESCGALITLDDIARQTGLRDLGVANCGLIDSLAPIDALRELEHLHMYESTRIADSDLTPLLQLTRLIELRMRNRRHYKPTVADVKNRLGLTK